MKIFKNLKSTWAFLKVYKSPFKPLKLTWYFGEIRYGHPFFLPRKKIKKKDMYEFKPITKFGIDWNALGWKTKFNDYRFEWNPSMSLILFGKQLYVRVSPNIDGSCMDDIYWEAWLTYENETDKTKTELERVKELIGKYSCTWRHYRNGVETSTNHYKDILKEKYQYLILGPK